MLVIAGVIFEGQLPHEAFVNILSAKLDLVLTSKLLTMVYFNIIVVNLNDMEKITCFYRCWTDLYY